MDKPTDIKGWILARVPRWIIVLGASVSIATAVVFIVGIAILLIIGLIGALVEAVGLDTFMIGAIALFFIIAIAGGMYGELDKEIPGRKKKHDMDQVD